VPRDQNSTAFAAVVAKLVVVANFILGGGGAPRVMCLRIFDENPKFDLRWLYIAMVAS
jgi:hypothetical protein